MHIYDYKIVEDAYLPNVETFVREYIGEGWQPHGSLVTHPQTDRNYAKYMQPIVRIEPYETP